MVLERLLQSWGYQVTSCSRGDEALRHLKRGDAPPMAILDWIMPAVDGLEVCRQAKELHPGLYVLLFTTRNKSQDIRTAVNAGADDYISKPVNAAELKLRIRNGERIIGLQKQLDDARRQLKFRKS